YTTEIKRARCPSAYSGLAVVVRLRIPDLKSPVRPEEALANMIASLKEKTGRSLEEWRTVIAGHGWSGHGVIVKGLKETYGLTHGYANQIALRSKEEATPSGDPIVEMLIKRPEAKAIY